MGYFAWMMVSLAIVAGSVYLIATVSPWFILMLLFIPSATSSKQGDSND